MRVKTEKEKQYQREYVRRKYREDPEYRKRSREACLKYYNEHKDNKEWRMKKCERARLAYARRKLQKENEDKKVQTILAGCQ